MKRGQDKRLASAQMTTSRGGGAEESSGRTEGELKKDGFEEQGMRDGRLTGAQSARELPA